MLVLNLYWFFAIAGVVLVFGQYVVQYMSPRKLRILCAISLFVILLHGLIIKHPEHYSLDHLRLMDIGACIALGSWSATMTVYMPRIVDALSARWKAARKGKQKQ